MKSPAFDKNRVYTGPRLDRFYCMKMMLSIWKTNIYFFLKKRGTFDMGMTIDNKESKKTIKKSDSLDNKDEIFICWEQFQYELKQNKKILI